MSASTLAIHGKGGAYGSSILRKSHSKLMRKTHMKTESEVHYGSLFSAGQPDIPRQRNFRVEAGWLFKGGEGLDATCERSESANEDILIFFFQLDLATRVQVCIAVFQFISFSSWYQVRKIETKSLDLLMIVSKRSGICLSYFTNLSFLSIIRSLTVW